MPPIGIQQQLISAIKAHKDEVREELVRLGLAPKPFFQTVFAEIPPEKLPDSLRDQALAAAQFLQTKEYLPTTFPLAQLFGEAPRAEIPALPQAPIFLELLETYRAKICEDVGMSDDEVDGLIANLQKGFLHPNQVSIAKGIVAYFKQAGVTPTLLNVDSIPSVESSSFNAILEKLGLTIDSPTVFYVVDPDGPKHPFVLLESRIEDIHTSGKKGWNYLLLGEYGDQVQFANLHPHDNAYVLGTILDEIKNGKKEVKRGWLDKNTARALGVKKVSDFLSETGAAFQAQTTEMGVLSVQLAVVGNIVRLSDVKTRSPMRDYRVMDLAQPRSLNYPWMAALGVDDQNHPAFIWVKGEDGVLMPGVILQSTDSFAVISADSPGSPYFTVWEYAAQKDIIKQIMQVANTPAKTIPRSFLDESTSYLVFKPHILMALEEGGLTLTKKEMARLSDDASRNFQFEKGSIRITYESKKETKGKKEIISYRPVSSEEIKSPRYTSSVAPVVNDVSFNPNDQPAFKALGIDENSPSFLWVTDEGLKRPAVVMITDEGAVVLITVGPNPQFLHIYQFDTTHQGDRVDLICRHILSPEKTLPLSLLKDNLTYVGLTPSQTQLLKPEGVRVTRKEIPELGDVVNTLSISQGEFRQRIEMPGQEAGIFKYRPMTRQMVEEADYTNPLLKRLDLSSSSSAVFYLLSEKHGLALPCVWFENETKDGGWMLQLTSPTQVSLRFFSQEKDSATLKIIRQALAATKKFVKMDALPPSSISPKELMAEEGIKPKFLSSQDGHIQLQGNDLKVSLDGKEETYRLFGSAEPAASNAPVSAPIAPVDRPVFNPENHPAFKALGVVNETHPAFAWVMDGGQRKAGIFLKSTNSDHHVFFVPGRNRGNIHIYLFDSYQNGDLIDLISQKMLSPEKTLPLFLLKERNTFVIHQAPEAQMVAAGGYKVVAEETATLGKAETTISISNGKYRQVTKERTGTVAYVYRPVTREESEKKNFTHPLHQHLKANSFSPAAFFIYHSNVAIPCLWFENSDHTSGVVLQLMPSGRVAVRLMEKTSKLFDQIKEVVDRQYKVLDFSKLANYEAQLFSTSVAQLTGLGIEPKVLRDKKVKIQLQGSTLVVTTQTGSDSYALFGATPTPQPVVAPPAPAPSVDSWAELRKLIAEITRPPVVPDRNFDFTHNDLVSSHFTVNKAPLTILMKGTTPKSLGQLLSRNNPTTFQIWWGGVGADPVTYQAVKKRNDFELTPVNSILKGKLILSRKGSHNRLSVESGSELDRFLVSLLTPPTLTVTGDVGPSSELKFLSSDRNLSVKLDPLLSKMRTSDGVSQLVETMTEVLKELRAFQAAFHSQQVWKEPVPDIQQLDLSTSILLPDGQNVTDLFSVQVKVLGNAASGHSLTEATIAWNWDALISQLGLGTRDAAVELLAALGVTDMKPLTRSFNPPLAVTKDGSLHLNIPLFGNFTYGFQLNGPQPPIHSLFRKPAVLAGTLTKTPDGSVSELQIRSDSGSVLSVSVARQVVVGGKSLVLVAPADLPRLRLWMHLMGAPLAFTPRLHSDVEVLMNGENFLALRPVKITSEVLHAQEINLPGEMGKSISEALDPEVVLGASSSTEAVVSPTTTLNFPRSSLSWEEMLRFNPGEALVPSQRTLQMIQSSWTEKADGTFTNSFVAGSLYPYELEALESGVTLRFLVRFRSDRRTMPFELVPGQPVTVFPTDQGIAAGIVIPASKLQIYSQGVTWRFTLLTSEMGVAHVKKFDLVSVVSKYSSFLVAAVNQLNDQHEVDADDVESYKAEAEKQLHQKMREVLGLEPDELPPFLFSDAKVRVNRAKSIDLLFFSKSQGVQHWADLSGITFDKSNGHVVFDSFVSLQIGKGSDKEGGGREIVKNYSRLIPTLIRQVDAVYRLIEVDAANHPTGKFFDWDVTRGTLQEYVPVEGDEEDIQGFLKKLNIPAINPVESRNFRVRRRAQETPKIFMERKVPVIPPDQSGFVYPDPTLTQPAPAADIPRILDTLHTEVFLPVEESLNAQILNGRPRELMTFVSHSGAILQIPMDFRAAGRTKDQYVVQDEADPHFGISGARLWVKAGEGYTEVPCYFHQRTSQGGVMDVSLVVGPDELPFKLTRVSTETSINGQKAFAFIARDPEKPGLNPANARAALMEWMEYNGLEDTSGYSAAQNFKMGAPIELPDGRKLKGHIQKLGKSGIFKLIGLRFSSTERGPQAAAYLDYEGPGGVTGVFRVFRDPFSCTYYLQDENHKPGTYLRMIISKFDGKPYFWERSGSLKEFLTAPPTPGVRMVAVDGSFYENLATSVVNRKGNEITASLGRWRGASDAGLNLDLIPAKVLFNVTTDDAGRLVFSGAQLKPQGKGQNWMDASIRYFEDPTGRLRIYLRQGKNYAWFEFENRRHLLDPEDSSFEVVQCHYNHKNLSDHNLFPEETGFLGKWVDVIRPNPLIEFELKAKLTPENWLTLLRIQGKAENLPILQRILETYGELPLDSQGQINPRWSVALKSLLLIAAEFQAQDPQVRNHFLRLRGIAPDRFPTVRRSDDTPAPSVVPNGAGDSGETQIPLGSQGPELLLQGGQAYVQSPVLTPPQMGWVNLQEGQLALQPALARAKNKNKPPHRVDPFRNRPKLKAKIIEAQDALMAEESFAYQAALLEKIKFILEEASETEVTRFLEQLPGNSFNVLPTVVQVYFEGRPEVLQRGKEVVNDPPPTTPGGGSRVLPGGQAMVQGGALLPGAMKLGGRQTLQKGSLQVMAPVPAVPVAEDDSDRVLNLWRGLLFKTSDDLASRRPSPHRDELIRILNEIIKRNNAHEIQKLIESLQGNSLGVSSDGLIRLLEMRYLPNQPSLLARPAASNTSPLMGAPTSPFLVTPPGAAPAAVPVPVGH